MNSNRVRNGKWSDGDKSDLVGANKFSSGALLLYWSRVVGTALMVAPRDSA